MKNNERFRLRTQAAAEYCSLSKSTLEKLRLTGNGPVYIALGRAIAYDTADLDEWMMRNKRRSTSEVSTLSAKRLVREAT